MSRLSPELITWLSETRRDFHRHPEKAYTEDRTSDRIEEILTGLGLEVSRFEDITGVVGLLEGGADGPTLGMRADIDALVMDELNEHDYKSVHPGLMHACGHDAHNTIMLGVAKHLVESGLKDKLKGRVKFLFQPAEEGGAGAKAMIERGVLENPRVDRIIAGHMLPDLEVGVIGVFEKMSHASADMFKITVTGKGSHGARPHQGNDPIVAASHLVTAVQTIVSRNIDPLGTAVVTIGSFQSGSASNVIPEKAELMGTTRALTQEIREALHRRLGQVCQGIEEAFGVEVKYELMNGYPPCVNDPEVSKFMAATAEKVASVKRVEIMGPSTGGEDFAFFTELRPGSIIRLGCGFPGKDNPPLHSPWFDIDERVLGIGVEVFTQASLDYLS